MRKVHIVSSLLVAFGLSIFSMGCDPAKKPATNPVKKVSGPGSTTGGGTEVPGGTSGVISNDCGSKGPDKNAPEGGTAEKPEAKPAEEKKPEDKPAEEKTEAKPEEKPAEDKKAEDK